MEEDKALSLHKSKKINLRNDEELYSPQNLEFFNSEFNEDESKSSKQGSITIELIEKASDKNFDHEIKRKKIKSKEQEFNFFEEDELENDSHSSSEKGLLNLDFMDNICHNDERKEEKIIPIKIFRHDPNDFSFSKKSIDEC